ncbi:DUF4258 domain-containing protein [Candidatus Woesearchaeota archaeon]|nr:DUF4258 domain-containing protein [Candidatus Woesearchaeota archaeon]
MILEISRHAKEKMDIEGIDEDQIINAIKMGSKTRQTDGYLATYTYIKVAYKKRGDVYRIKTVFVEK